MTIYLTNLWLFLQDTTLEINELEYKMARRLKASEIQMDAYRKYEAELERKKILRTGYNNAIRAVDHMMFDDENVDDFISSHDESAAKRSTNASHEKPVAKRPNNGSSCVNATKAIAKSQRDVAASQVN